MKRTFLIPIAAAVLVSMTGCYISFSGSSGWSNTDLKAVTNLVQSAAIPDGLKTLEVINAFGAVRITGADNGPFGWSQKLTVRARTDAVVQQLASNLLCRADLAGDRLKLVVTVPKSVAVQARNQYGRTEIIGLNGDVDAEDKFGAVEVRDISGTVRAETSYAALKAGNIGPATLKNAFGSIDAVGIHGPLDAETSYATLDARDIAGTVKLRNQFGAVRIENAGNADIRTSYAKLRVKEINGDARLVNQFGHVAAEDVTGSVRAETSYGAMDIIGPGGSFSCDNQFGGITVRATSATVTNLEARTSYGSLTVRLPAGLKPAIEAHTSYGNIKADFPVVMKSNGQDASSDQPAGAPRVNLRNQNGNIRVVAE